MTQKRIEFIRTKGFFIYSYCGNIYELPMTLLKTFSSLIGGMGLKGYWPIIGSRIHEYQTNANINLAKEILNYEWNRLPFRVNHDYSDSLIKNGDFIGITRFDLIDQII